MDPPTPVPPAPTEGNGDDDTVMVKMPSDRSVVVEFPVSENSTLKRHTFYFFSSLKSEV